MQITHAAMSWMRGVMSMTPRDTTVHPVVAPDPAATIAALKVLLVDDDEVNRTLACAQLLRFGIEPTLACDGQQAVEWVTAEHFDVVLMDLSMPVMDGFEATERIRRLERERPERRRVAVVAYTAGAAADDHEMLQRRGFDAVLRKPCNMRMVRACLEQVCGVGPQ